MPITTSGRAAPRLVTAGLLLLALLASLVGPAPRAARAFTVSPATVFINEIHYDNSGTDAGEFVEIAGPAGTNLAGWSIVLYNGSGGVSYTTTPLSGTLADQGGGFGALSFAYPVNGIQNGAPDGVALVNGTALVQFLSYEGSFTATNGPASGVTSTDIGVSQNGTEAIGSSLHLNGTGTTYQDFLWAATSDDSPGAINGGQTFQAAGPLRPVINEFSASTTGTDVEYVEFFGSPNTDYAAYTLLEIEGDVGGVATGTIDEVLAVGTTDANGLYLANLPANALENGTLTLLLVEGFSGALGADLDTNDDGILDAAPWTALVDAVAVNDGGAGDLTYGTPSLGVAYDGAAFAPGGASRIPDGTDTDTAADWVRNDFDLAGIAGLAGTPVAGEALNTPGVANQAITVDSATVTIEATDGDAAEAGSATGSFRISRTGSTAAALVVSYTLAGSASAADYSPALAGTAELATGAAFVDIVITPVDDADVEGPETLTLNLSAGTGYLLGAATSASVTIVDNDAAVVITPIHAIQGSGATAAAGTFTVEAIVVGDYQTQGSGQLRGFFIQEEDADADADPATSEGIFVFCGACPTAVAVGDKVRVTGASSEFFNMSQLTASTAGSVSVVSSNNALPTPAAVQLPVPGVPSGDLAAATAAINAYFEAFEGMLVSFPATLAVSEYFELARYGQVILSEGGRPRTFTDANVPSAAGLIDHEINLASRTIILDDTDNRQNRPVDAPNTAYYHPVPGLSTGNFIRGGDTITGLTGVLHWSFAGQTGTDAWRIRPVVEQYSYAFTPVNQRQAAPVVGGSLKVASFNVLNYFLTVDTTASNDVGFCGPTLTADCRGADSAQELERQRAKLTQALLGLDADVVGLIEMENTPGVTPTLQIVSDLNAILGAGTYAYVDTGVIGTDAIRVGMIYKPARVAPVGDFAILDSSVDPNFIDTRNRPALAQTFEEAATGARFTVVVNHLKSKGSGCGAGDDDTTTGQGNCNGTRTLAAQALAGWLATDPTGSGDPDVLIIGDLNSYAKEDPIVALQSAGYTDLVAAFGGPDAYSYVFDGQLGYLDHALANPSLRPQVASVAEWHINADEIPLFDYNDDVRDPGEAAFEEESDILPLYEATAYRTSDHDPVLVGLSLDGLAPTTTASVTGATNPLCPSGCFQGSATVTLTAVDAQSSVVGTQYRVNGGGFQPYGAPFTVSTEGATLVEFFSTDAAGNVEAIQSATVKVTNFPATARLDAFDRANGRLGSSWTGATQSDQYAIRGGVVKVGKGGLALWRPTAYGASQEAFMRLTALSASSPHHTLALKVRGNSGRDGAILVSYDAVGAQVTVEALVVGKGFRTVASYPVTAEAGALLGARALSDGTVEVYVDCALVGTADTRSVAGNAYVNRGGSIGVWYFNAAGATFDDFGGGNR